MLSELVSTDALEEIDVGQASDEEVPMNADTYESEWFQWFLDEGYGSEDDE